MLCYLVMTQSEINALSKQTLVPKTNTFDFYQSHIFSSFREADDYRRNFMINRLQHIISDWKERCGCTMEPHHVVYVDMIASTTKEGRLYELFEIEFIKIYDPPPITSEQIKRLFKKGKVSKTIAGGK